GFVVADGGNYRDELVILQGTHDGGFDQGDIADETDVQLFARAFRVVHHLLAGLNQAAILAGQTNCLATGSVDHHDDVLLYLAAQHPLDHFHGFGVGNTHALYKGAFLADALEGGINLRAAAVNHHGVNAHQLEQHDVVREAALQMFFRHGVAAVLDDHGLTVEATDVRQGLGKNGGLDGSGVLGFGVGHVVFNVSPMPCSRLPGRLLCRSCPDSDE